MQPIAIFRESLEAAERRNDPVESVRFAVLLANALIDKEAFAEARGAPRADGRARSRFARPDLPSARLLVALPPAHAAERHLLPRPATRRRALELLDLTEHTYYTALAHQLLAHIEIDRKQADEALELIRNGLSMLGDSGTKIDRALFRLEEARALLQLGRRDEAAAIAMESAGVLADASPFDAGRGIHDRRPRSSRSWATTAKARELYELAAEMLEPVPSRYLIEVYQKLAELLEAEGRKDEALEVLKKAVTIQAARPLITGSVQPLQRSQGGTTAQKKAAGRKGGKASSARVDTHSFAVRVRPPFAVPSTGMRTAMRRDRPLALKSTSSAGGRSSSRRSSRSSSPVRALRHSPRRSDREPRIRAIRAKADAFVSGAQMTKNFGRARDLRIDASPTLRTYVRFKADLSAGDVERVNLLLFSRNRSRVGYQVRLVEEPLARDRDHLRQRPARLAADFVLSGPLRASAWKAVDVTSLVEDSDGGKSSASR